LVLRDEKRAGDLVTQDPKRTLNSSQNLEKAADSAVQESREAQGEKEVLLESVGRVSCEV
jgi:hypothetical protein